MGVLWGCFGFLGGAGAPASPFLAPPMYIGRYRARIEGGWHPPGEKNDKKHPLCKTTIRPKHPLGLLILCRLLRKNDHAHYMLKCSTFDHLRN